MRKRTQLLALCAAAVLILGTQAVAAIVTVPAGLNPGDPYRLIFPTSTEIYGRSSAGGPTDISGYNTFATNTATAVTELNDLATTWLAVVSVEQSGSPTFVSAKSNTGTDPGFDGVGVPIYNLAGQIVATGNADLWDGSIANLINVTELGTAPADQGDGDDFLVWTGSQPDGTGNSDNSLITPSGGWIRYGNTALTTSSASFPFKSWIGSLGGETGWDANGNTNSEMPIYVMSGILTAPEQAVVPEPSTFALALLGLMGLVFCVKKRE